MKKLGKIVLAFVLFMLPFIISLEKVNAQILQYGDVNEDGTLTYINDNADRTSDTGLIIGKKKREYSFTPIQNVLADGR